MSIGWGETGDAAALLEAFHRLDLAEQPWLQEIARAFGDLTPGSATIAGTYAWEPGQTGFRPVCMAGALGALAAETADQADPEFIAATMASDRRLYVLSDLFGARLPEMPVSNLLRAVDAADSLCLQSMVGGDPVEGVSMGATAPRRIELSEAGLSTWHRIASHLAAALRLRRGGLEAHPVESVLSPDGRVEHAEGSARGKDERASLTRAVKAIDRARRRDARTDPAAVLDAWRAIVERRWSLVDVVESDGRRYMLARVNPPVSVDHAELTPRERQVAALLVQGVPQKAVGYELAMSPSTVAFHVKNMARKLGAATSTELVRVLAARGAVG